MAHIDRRCAGGILPYCSLCPSFSDGKNALLSHVFQRAMVPCQRHPDQSLRRQQALAGPGGKLEGQSCSTTTWDDHHQQTHSSDLNRHLKMDPVELCTTQSTWRPGSCSHWCTKDHGWCTAPVATPACSAACTARSTLDACSWPPLRIGSCWRKLPQSACSRGMGCSSTAMSTQERLCRSAATLGVFNSPLCSSVLQFICIAGKSQVLSNRMVNMNRDGSFPPSSALAEDLEITLHMLFMTFQFCKCAGEPLGREGMRGVEASYRL